MAINAKDYIAKLPPEEQRLIQVHAEEMIAEEMNLAEIRNALQRSQADIAEKCGIKQAAVSRLERRRDMRISTLRNLVEAMGGSLSLVIRFSHRGPIHISQFGTPRNPYCVESQEKAALTEHELIIARLRTLGKRKAGAPNATAPVVKKIKKRDPGRHP